MRNKFFNTLIIIGLALFATVLCFCLLGYLSFNALWVRYIMLLSLLIMFIGLSKAFKKFTDYNEGVACLKRAMYTLNLIKSRDINKINYVRLLSIKNQLNNAGIYISNVVNNFDLYELKRNLKQLEIIERHYSLEKRVSLNKDIILTDIQNIEETYEKIKLIQSQNELIR